MNQSDNQDSLETERTEEQAEDLTNQDAPFVAKLVAPASIGDQPAESPTGDLQPSSGNTIRIGSPFQQDPADLPPADSPKYVGQPSGEAAYGEFGPFRYTAMGAATAAVVVLGFAALGAWWFPAGGALVAVLGTVLSIVGLFSTKRFRYAAIATLPIHMGLFVLSYVRSMT